MSDTDDILYTPRGTDNLTIWKFPLEPATPIHILAPQGAKPLYVDTQGGNEQPYVWMLVQPGIQNVKHEFRVVGTGHNMMRKEAKQYVGTFTMLDKGLVFHVFYNGEVE